MCVAEEAFLVEFVYEWECLFASLYDYLFVWFDVYAVVNAEFCEFFDSLVDHLCHRSEESK